MSKAVLVVDDEEGFVSVLTRLLSDEGWRAHGAQDGAEALLAIGRSRPSVILVDYMMPAMDGAALVAALRRNPTTRELPIVMMSGLPESMIARKVKGYTAFLQKPFRFDDLIARLDEAVAGATRVARRGDRTGSPRRR